jgi:hypothetical protein
MIHARCLKVTHNRLLPEISNVTDCTRYHSIRNSMYVDKLSLKIPGNIQNKIAILRNEDYWR